MHVILHVLEHSLEEFMKILPFLFLSYLLVEYMEHKMSAGTKLLIYRAGKAGPILGALLGVIPQCGFSAASAGLFAGGVLSPGTVIAVFLSTSDEMLPIMMSSGIAPGIIGRILTAKIVVGALAGLATDFGAEKLFGRRQQMPEHPHMCADHDCGCEEHGIWYSALNHTIRTALFLFLISAVLGVVMEVFGDSLADGLNALPGTESAICGLIGMIPNCAASVLITQLYLKGIIGSGALFAGLLCGAGTGLLVLYRENRSHKMNLVLTGILYVSGLAAGIVLGLLELI